MGGTKRKSHGEREALQKERTIEEGKKMDTSPERRREGKRDYTRREASAGDRIVEKRSPLQGNSLQRAWRVGGVERDGELERGSGYLYPCHELRRNKRFVGLRTQWAMEIGEESGSLNMIKWIS